MDLGFKDVSLAIRAGEELGAPSDSASPWRALPPAGKGTHACADHSAGAREQLQYPWLAWRNRRLLRSRTMKEQTNLCIATSRLTVSLRSV